MALQDILTAITTQADQAVATARAEHERRMAQLKSDTDADVERRARDVAEQKDQKLALMRQKAESFALMQSRHASVETKRRLLDEAYASVVKELASSPESSVEPLLAACVKTLPAGGTIRPAKAHAALLKKLADGRAIGDTIDAAGGFVYSSDDADVDCTFESLVERVLRPATELGTAASLFDAA